MKKFILTIVFLMLWASLAAAAQATGKNVSDAGAEETPAKLELPPEYRIGVGYYWIKNTGNTMASEYDYLKSSVTGAFDFQWDPLPHRFGIESYYLNNKDYFGEVDYAWKDIVLLNGYMRGLYHNLDHYILGPDDPTTSIPSFTDLNPGAEYNVENALRAGSIRLKTPDFPFHLYANVRTIDREGTIQQIFLSPPLHEISESREIDWNTTEYIVGMNSHLGPIEVDYNHMEKKFDPIEGKVMYDTTSGVPVPHNLVPNLQSSSDTVKAHTTYSGKIVLSGTYTSGDRTNEDSSAKVDFRNAAGDLMFMPVTPVILTVRYRHFDNTVVNPDSVPNITSTGTTMVNVRDSISSDRDVVSTMLRWRATDRLTFKGEFTTDKTDRTRGILGSTMVISTVPPVTGQAYWDVPESSTKNTGKIGLSYRILNRMTLRADYSVVSVDNPAYDTDPDRSTNARAALTWNVTPRFSTLLSFNEIHEERDLLTAPLAGGQRDARRDQALASATMLVGRYSSVTLSYGYFRNSVNQALTLTDGNPFPSLPLVVDPGVPYQDVSHIGTVTLTVAPWEGVNFVGSASRSYDRGNFTLYPVGDVTNTGGIAELSDMKVIDTVYSVGLEMQHTRYIGSDLRYEFRDYDDRINNTQDGRMRQILASLSVKW
jgi:hypothetical protein